jgi:hypothetical protein
MATRKADAHAAGDRPRRGNAAEVELHVIGFLPQGRILELERRPSLPDLTREQAADYRLMART